MEPRGIAGMELLAMEMKASGAYVARGLSWTDATFETVVAPLSDSLRHAYDKAAGFLKTLRRAVARAGDVVGVNAMNSYWSMHLRFCKELMVAAKVESVVSVAHRESVTRFHTHVLDLALADGSESGGCGWRLRAL